MLTDFKQHDLVVWLCTVTFECWYHDERTVTRRPHTQKVLLSLQANWKPLQSFRKIQNSVHVKYQRSIISTYLTFQKHKVYKEIRNFMFNIIFTKMLWHLMNHVRLTTLHTQTHWNSQLNWKRPKKIHWPRSWFVDLYESLGRNIAQIHLRREKNKWCKSNST